MKQALRDELGAAGRWLLPAICPLCTGQRDRKQPLCRHCLEQLTPLPEARCPRCDLPYPALDSPSHLCGDCSKHSPPFEAVCSLGPYTGLLKEAVGQLKYNCRPLLDRPFGQMLADSVRQRWPAVSFDLVVPVPLHSRRLRSRTFNQALLLARQIGKKLSIPVAAHQLRRVRYTPPQQSLKAAERLNNLQQALQVDGQLTDRSLLLIDDVMTTGATARACCKVLRQAGAREIRVAVLARAPRYLHL